MMRREDCRIGMRVYFGRANGEKTLGEIVRINPAKAKVKTLEQRGHGRGSEVGTEWGVPYSMLTLASPDAQGAPVQAPVELPKLTYNRFMPAEDRYVLLAIVSCYGSLSPENLTADGELPMTVVRRRKADLDRKLRGLFAAFGRTVSETEAYDWHRAYEADQRSRLVTA